MTNWGRLRGILIASIGVGGVFTYKALQNPGLMAQINGDLQDAAMEEPELAPFILKLCPECGADPKSAYYDIGGGSICRWQVDQWVECGIGKGCDVPCPVDPIATGAEPTPSNGPNRHWPAQVKDIIARDDRKEITEIIKRVTERRLAEQEAEGL